MLLGQVARVGEDGELVALERRVREDVADDVAEPGHAGNLLPGPGANPEALATASADWTYCGTIDIDTDAALLYGIGSRPPVTLKNARVPGRSLKYPLPLPPPRTLPFASNTTQDRVVLASVSDGWMLTRSPSTEPSQAGSLGLGTR